jgi:hypothetical protein
MRENAHIAERSRTVVRSTPPLVGVLLYAALDARLRRAMT